MDGGGQAGPVDAGNEPRTDSGVAPRADAGVIDRVISDAGGAAMRTFFFGHSLTSWPYPEGSVPADDRRSAGTGLCHAAGAANFDCCSDGRYPTSGPSLQRVQAAYGSPPTARSIDEQGGHRHLPQCDGGFGSNRWTHYVTVPNNFVIEVDANNCRGPRQTMCPWIEWVYQDQFPGDTNTLFQVARAQSPNSKLWWYEVPPGIFTGEGEPQIATWSDWINDTQTTRGGRGAERFGAMQEVIQDQINRARPTPDVYLIPVNRLLARALRPGAPLDAEANGIEPLDFGWDGAPHFRAEWFYLVGLIHYMALAQSLPPPGYEAPEWIPRPEIRNNIETIARFFWDEMNTEPLRSRIWGPLPAN